MNNIRQISVLSNEDVQQSIEDFASQGKTFRDAIGLIIQTPVVGFVMSFDEWQDPWGDDNSAITEEQSEAVALQTLSGLELTERIYNAQKNNKDSDITAAQRCWTYGKAGLQWHLPCLYELGVIAAYRDEINACLKRLGCPDEMLLSDNWYWSSSECSQSYSWNVFFSNGGFYGYSKCGSYDVRAVAAFRPCGSSSDETQKVTSQSSSDEMTEDKAIACLRSLGYTGTLTKTLTVEI